MFYHITKPENLHQILDLGIIANYKKGIGKDKHGKVFLTNNVEKIIETQLGRNHWKDILILYIDTQAKPHTYTSRGIEELSDFEFVTDYVPTRDIIGMEIIKL